MLYNIKDEEYKNYKFDYYNSYLDDMIDYHTNG